MKYKDKFQDLGKTLCQYRGTGLEVFPSPEKSHSTREQLIRVISRFPLTYVY